MTLALGVDTGGTYTDAVLVQDETEIVASAKSLTTRWDLAEGIAGAVQAVLAEAQVSAAEIGMAALSTTLATNALVEGHGQRAGLVFIGFQEADLDTHGLREALAGDPVLVLPGGHSHAGEEAAPLDLQTLRAWAERQDVGAFAVAAQFATRNPAHERAARETLMDLGRAVTCSHELSAKLGGPKRALTALLNARLIGLTHRLIGRAEQALYELGVNAPLMVVRGDGALMPAATASERPIETILSGPAASIVGASWLTGRDSALVSDIGGTTTDIAFLRDGRPAIDPDGARVGGFRTMVEAVAMRTHGLGGDSEVHPITEGLSGGVTLGPGRVIPISLAATWSKDVIATLEDQARRALPGEHDARFALRVRTDIGIEDRDRAVFERLTERPTPLGEIARRRLDMQALRRLVRSGAAQVCGVTPTDAAHALGHASHWSQEAATLALGLMARRRTGSGETLAPDAVTLAGTILSAVTRQTRTALLEAAFTEEGWPSPEALSQHPLTLAGLSGHRGLIETDLRLGVPVVGLGASAKVYYPAVGEAVGTEMVLPRHADVANAIGAVVGRVTVRRAGSVTSLGEGRYRAHLTDGPKDFSTTDGALDALRSALEADARASLGQVDGVTLHHATDLRTAQVEGREMFVEATLRVEASARPRIAS